MASCWSVVVLPVVSSIVGGMSARRASLVATALSGVGVVSVGSAMVAL